MESRVTIYREWPMPIPAGPLRYSDPIGGALFGAAPRYTPPDDPMGALRDAIESTPQGEAPTDPPLQFGPDGRPLVDTEGADPDEIRLREEWLEAAAELTRDAFAQLDPAVTLPDFRVSVGYPLGSRGGAIGATHNGKLSADGLAQVFLSPRLAHPVDLVGTLIHEAIHVAIGTEKGHGKEFRKVARGIGLTGRMVATYPGEELERRIVSEWTPILGAFPHATLADVPIPEGGVPMPPRLPRGPDGRIRRPRIGPEERERRRKAYRMIRAHCPECSLIVRGARSTLERAALLCDGGEGDRKHDPTRLVIG